MALEDDERDYKETSYNEQHYESKSVSLMELSCLCLIALTIQSLSGFILILYGSAILLTVGLFISFEYAISSNIILFIAVIPLIPVGILQFIITYKLFKRSPNMIKNAIVLNVIVIILFSIISVNVFIIDSFIALAIGANILSPILFQLNEVKSVFGSE